MSSSQPGAVLLLGRPSHGQRWPYSHVTLHAMGYAGPTDDASPCLCSVHERQICSSLLGDTERQQSLRTEPVDMEQWRG
jgi:hypothetical protein